MEGWRWRRARRLIRLMPPQLETKGADATCLTRDQTHPRVASVLMGAAVAEGSNCSVKKRKKKKESHISDDLSLTPGVVGVNVASLCSLQI